jgi:hypothetical protein
LYRVLKFRFALLKFWQPLQLLWRSSYRSVLDVIKRVLRHVKKNERENFYFFFGLF